MKINYSLIENDKGKIEKITEKLYQKRAEIGDTVINWERFTEEFMKFPLPDIDDELTNIRWVNARPSWVVIINGELRYRSYPMQLFVSNNSGIYVRILGAAVNEVARRRVQKSINALRTSIDMLEDLKNSKGYPNSIRVIDATINTLYGTMNELKLGLGKVVGLPSPLRKELGELVDKKMPNLDRL